MAEYKKLTINVSPELHEDLQRMANERGITITELIRRAVALDKFVHEHRDAELLLREGNKVRQIVPV
jgi:hypothetical protein